MISLEGIPNCGSCRYYSEGFCNVNPTYLGRAPECHQFGRITTTAKIDKTVRKFKKVKSKPPLQMITGPGNPLYFKLIERGVPSYAISEDGVVRCFVFDKKYKTV